MKRIIRATETLFAVAVIWALSLGATRLVGENLHCGDDPGELGTCPPYTESSCGSACANMFGTSGSCLIIGSPGMPYNCCICQL
jgi:hypothetical protein